MPVPLAAPSGASCSACSSSRPSSAWPWARRPARCRTLRPLRHRPQVAQRGGKRDSTGRLRALCHGAQHESRASAAGDGQVRRHRAQDELHGRTAASARRCAVPARCLKRRLPQWRGSGLGRPRRRRACRPGSLPLIAPGGSRTRRRPPAIPVTPIESRPAPQ